MVMATRNPPQPSPSSQTRNQRLRATPPLQTSSNKAQPQKRYSFMETPLEMQNPVFQQFSSPTNSTIDESPITPASPSRALPGYDHQDMRGTPLPEEKAMEAQLQAPPVQTHPAFTAPVPEATRRTQQASQSAAAPSAVPNPSQSPGPIPIKGHTNGSTTTTPVIHSTISPDLILGPDRRETYNPHALQGPNVGASNHRPGQVSHPNASVNRQWKHGLCEPDPLCCMGLFCPCMLYGRTMYRLSRKAQKQDPTDMLGYESCNGGCGLFAAACGLQGILAAINRTRIRKIYKIDGSIGADCVKSLCCCCCVVAQNEREVKEREEWIRRHAGPGARAYVAPVGGMTYAPPPR